MILKSKNIKIGEPILIDDVKFERLNSFENVGNVLDYVVKVSDILNKDQSFLVNTIKKINSNNDASQVALRILNTFHEISRIKIQNMN